LLVVDLFNPSRLPEAVAHAIDLELRAVGAE
jgi:hypothetical protein